MPKKISTTTATANAPSHEAIAQRAHEIWENEGRPEGRAMEHWLRAVSELKAQSNGSHSEPRESQPRPARRTTPTTEKRFQTAT